MNTELYDKLNVLITAINSPGYEEFITVSSANPGAVENELERVEDYFKFKLPEEYKVFLKWSNGCSLFNCEDLDGYLFFSAEKLPVENEFQREIYEDAQMDSILVICSLLGDGDYIGLRIINEKEYEVLDIYHDESPANWNVITHSFNEFLDKLIDLKGRKYWL